MNGAVSIDGIQFEIEIKSKPRRVFILSRASACFSASYQCIEGAVSTDGPGDHVVYVSVNAIE
jgi:hypothetical protein